MKFIKYSTIFLIVFLIETNFIDLISIKGITPNIILIFLLFISLKENQTTSTITGFVAGLFQDVLSFNLIGISSLTNSIACFLGSYFDKTKSSSSIPYLALVFFVVTIIYDRIYRFIFLLGTNQQFFRSFFLYSVPKSIYTTIIALILNFIFHRTIWQQSEL